MRTPLALGALVLLLVLATVAWLARDRHATAVVDPAAAGETRSAHGAPLALPRADDLARESAVATRADDHDAATEPAAQALAPLDETRLVVFVVEDGSELPLVRAQLTLRNGSERPFVDVTDERGELNLAVRDVPASLGDLVHVSVVDADGHARLRASIVLQHPRIGVRVPPKLRLHGEVVLASGSSTRGLTLSAWIPPHGIHGVERFVAHQDLADGGRFEIACGVERAPAAFTLRVSGGSGVPASVRVPTAELTSPSGARVVVGLSRLSIVVDEDGGAPVASAIVRCAATASSDGSSALFTEATTGADGRARVWVPAGPIAVSAGTTRHASAQADVVVGSTDVEVALTLRPLGDADVLAGSVVLDDGSPVAGAFVSAWCASDAGDLAVVSMQQGSTDPDGRFRIATAIDRELRVFAIAKEHGESGEQTWKPRDPPIRLVIDRGVALEVVARGLPSGSSRRADDAAIVLVDDGGRSRTLGTDHFPVTFDRLPLGRWRAYAIAAEDRRWASAEVVVERDRENRLELDFVPLDQVTGRVEPAADPDRRLAVAFAPVGWPASAIETLSTEAIDPDGTFRVAAPGPGEISLVESARDGSPRTIERRPARGGTSLVFTLPD